MLATSRLPLLALLAGLCVAGCPSTDAPPTPTPTTAAVPEAAAPAAAEAAAPAAKPAARAAAPAQALIVGTVKETMNSGGYTYALLDTGSGQTWIAGPETKAAVGDRMEASDGSPMMNFTSKTLNRTFDRIVFASFLRPAGAAKAAPAPAEARPAAAAARPAAAAAVAVPVEPLAGGTTVAAVWADVATLAGKPVSLRGRVVKLNRGILGSDWLHLQDGTGAADKGTHDLTVTAAPGVKVAVGDVVVVKGTVVADKDFGAGYKYAVMVEKATVTVE